MKRYRYLLIVFLSAVAILLVIFYFGDIPNKHDNGFKRRYLPDAVSILQEIHFEDTLHEIVGATPWHIYLSTATKGDILEVGRDAGGQIKRIKIPLFDRFYDSLQLSSLSVKIDSPRIYLFAENKPAIIKTDFDSTLFEVRILPPGPFTREAMIGADRFILRKIEPRLTDQVFVRYDLNTGRLQKEAGISPLYGDGGIISDGQLHFDAQTEKLYYIYYYKNLLLSFDSSLSSVTRFSSIDTNNSFNMRTGLVKNEGMAAYTNITPANIINKVNYVGNGLLFNMSSLKADNETGKFFADHSILDIISLRNGKYLGSLSIPISNGSKLSKFMVTGDRLIALYSNSMIVYGLHAPIDLQDQ